MPIAFRLLGNLLLGLVRIFAWKVDYTLSDCNRLLTDIRIAISNTKIDLPGDANQAPPHSVTLPSNSQLDSIDLDNLADDADNDAPPIQPDGQKEEVECRAPQSQQQQKVVAGTHPRTEFYAEFHVAKAMWMLHLLAFALDPAPTHFEVRKGAEFQMEFMESVVRFPSGRVPAGSVVAFSVAPGFRLSNGSVVRARVYLNPGNPGQ